MSLFTPLTDVRYQSKVCRPYCLTPYIQPGLPALLAGSSGPYRHNIWKVLNVSKTVLTWFSKLCQRASWGLAMMAPASTNWFLSWEFSRVAYHWAEDSMYHMLSPGGGHGGYCYFGSIVTSYLSRQTQEMLLNIGICGSPHEQLCWNCSLDILMIFIKLKYPQ